MHVKPYSKGCVWWNNSGQIDYLEVLTTLSSVVRICCPMRTFYLHSKQKKGVYLHCFPNRNCFLVCCQHWRWHDADTSQPMMSCPNEHSNGIFLFITRSIGMHILLWSWQTLLYGTNFNGGPRHPDTTQGSMHASSVQLIIYHERWNYDLFISLIVMSEKLNLSYAYVIACSASSWQWQHILTLEHFNSQENRALGQGRVYAVVWDRKSVV